MKRTFITIDIESYFDKDCSIKKLGPSQYVAHPDFEILSLSYKTAKMGQAKFVGGPEAVKAFLERLKKKQDRIIMCGHNLYFDAYALMFHYDFRPAFFVDTLCMAQVLDSHEGPLDLAELSKKYKAPQPKIEMPNIKGKYWKDLDTEERKALKVYNNIDTEATEHIAIGQLQYFPQFELRVIDLTLKMFVDPVIKIDAEQAQAVIDEEQELKRTTLAEAVKILRKKKGAPARKPSAKDIDTMGSIVRSNDKFKGLLEACGYECPMKRSEKQEKEIPAIAKADLPFQRMMDSDDASLKALVDARLASKSSINETRAKALLQRASYPMPIGLMYASAHTLRWGGTDKVNPQNLPRDGRLRRCLTAPDGYVFVIVDASQIEARDVATSSEQWDLVESFRQGNDVYAEFASDLYNFEVNKIDNPEERFVGKTAILGLGFQCGAPKFQLILEAGMMGPPLKISQQESQQIVNLYRTKYYKIKQQWYELQSKIPYMMENSHNEIEHQGAIIKPNGRVLMPNGLHLYYPGLTYKIHPDFGTPEFEYWPFDKKYRKPVQKKLFGGLFLENLTQCRARIMTTEHMLELARYYRVVMMAHDEIVMCVPIKKADACLHDALEIMSIPPRWNEHCPLAAEGEISPFYTKP